MQRKIECHREGITLRGVVHIPDNHADKVPAVILLHGFTGTKAEFSFSFVETARELEKRGIACFRFDFYGSGDSDGRFLDMSIATETADALVMIEYVKSQRFADKSRIGLLGMSMGGAVASIAAGIRKDDIKALCLWAPGASMPDAMRRGHYAPYPLDEATKKRGYVNVNGMKLGMRFFADLENADIYGDAKKYDKHVLIIHGDKDKAVPFRYSEKYMKHYGSKAKLIKVEGAGHLFDQIEHHDTLIQSSVNFLAGELG